MYFMCLYILYRDVKYLKTSLALIAGSFYLDAKIEQILKKILKISLILFESLLANASRQVQFYTPIITDTNSYYYDL